MASAANLVSFNSDSEPDDDATYFEETFSSEHLGLGADPFPLPGELHPRMRPTRRNVAMAGEYKFPRCLAAHCAGCRALTCGELQMQGNLGQNDGCPQCQVDRIDLCHRRGQCIHFNQQQATLFASTQQLVLPPASSPAPSLRPASPLPPGKIETI